MSLKPYNTGALTEVFGESSPAKRGFLKLAKASSKPTTEVCGFQIGMVHVQSHFRYAWRLIKKEEKCNLISLSF